MVVEVEADQPSQALAIARQVVEPLQSRYDEVLIYTREPEAPMPARRVQWTPRTGYIEMVITPER
jgi:hypothetical protein